LGLVCALGVASCSALFDWNGYTGGTGGSDGDDAAADATADAPVEAASCSSTCLGCCSNGVCFAGSIAKACGTAGTTCTDCSQKRQACTNGACAVAPVIDSGPSCTDDECVAMNYTCSGIGKFYTPQPCCQPNGTCGCTPNPVAGGPPLGCVPKF